MKVENTIVTVGETPKEKCPSYDKLTAENFADSFDALATAGDVPITPAVAAAAKLLDEQFPDIVRKDKDGKEETIPSPIRKEYLRHFNYGLDLFQKATTRRKFEATLEDPSKIVVSAVNGMIASGFDADTAYELVLAQRSAKGMETTAKDVVLSKIKK